MKPLANIELVISDIDGTWTDGGLYYSEKGEQIVKFNARDGIGVGFLHVAGVAVGVVSGNQTAALQCRLDDLKVVFRRITHDKGRACKELCEISCIVPENTLYIGDDLNDSPAFDFCGVTACPGDAPDYIKKRVDIALDHSGGDGAFRELADMVIEAKGLDIIELADQHYGQFRQ